MLCEGGVPDHDSSQPQSRRWHQTGRETITTEIYAEIATGPKKGEMVLISRIDLATPDAANSVPIKFQRRQFPVTLALPLQSTSLRDRH